MRVVNKCYILINIFTFSTYKQITLVCTKLQNLKFKIAKAPYRGRGGTPPPTPYPRSVASLPRAWSLRSLAMSHSPNIKFCPPTEKILRTALSSTLQEHLLNFYAQASDYLN